MSDVNPSGLSDNAAGGIAYLTIIPAIVFLIIDPFRKSSYVRFHAWQSIFLNIAAIIFSICLSFVTVFSYMVGIFFFLMFTRLLWLAFFLVWVFCVVKALNGERFKLPLIGDLAAKQAGS